MPDGSNNGGYLKTTLFAFVLCMVCGSLLTLSATGLKRYQLENIAIDKQKNILRVVNLSTAGDVLSPREVVQRFTENIRQGWINGTGDFTTNNENRTQDLPIYLYGNPEKPEAYIIPVNSRGLWGKIHGYMAIDKDGATISGFTVYSHSETPGLGGEIEKSWFQDNFKGKKIIDAKGDFVSVGIVKGQVEEVIAQGLRLNYVDGISGATLTGKYLSAGLKQLLLKYELFSKKFRKSRLNPSDKKVIGFGTRSRGAGNESYPDKSI